MTTEWRFLQLPKYPNRIICDNGEIFSSINGRKLNLKPSRDGYLRVRMYKPKKEYYSWVHRMVCYAFVGNCEGKDCHHKDRDITNNNWWNFEIKTEQEHYAEHRQSI